ncbi:MAG TPA: DUF3038 domain-containing protein [Candidatus Obscuribacterales bacterium]
MNVSVSVMPSTSPSAPSAPLFLENLPDPDLSAGVCPRRARLEIDLMLLAIEALDLGGSEAILSLVKELELQGIIQNRVALWRLRSTNPLRRYSQRQPLSLVEAKALVAIACHLARRLTVVIRQLLLAYQQLTEKQLSVEHHFRLYDYLERFRAHFRARMNPRRAGVLAYSSDEKLNELALSLLGKLLFCTGTFGMQRFWISLFDGEVE